MLVALLAKLIAIAVVIIIPGLLTVVVLVHAEEKAEEEEQLQLLPIPQVIVAIGDSFAAGNGANQYDPRVPECFRSPLSWAAQFAKKINLNSTFINRGCSSGKFVHINSERYLRTVRRDRRGKCPVSSSGLDDYYVNQGKTRKCDHFVLPQLLSLNTTQADLVLFAMGANDMQFGALIAQCFFYAYLNPSGCQQQMNFIRNYAPTWTQDLANVLIAMAPFLKPTARVVVMQFPHIVVNQSYSYNPIVGPTVELTNNIRSLGYLLDESQRAAIEMANSAVNRAFIVYYNQSKLLFTGHEPNPATLWNRNAWFIENLATIPLLETYHFNPTGHTQLANDLYNFMVPFITPLTWPS
jgi:lysophospholipase L1-like esterase